MKPNKCPTCDGKGMVPPGFYPDGSETNWETCRSCEGGGIIVTRSEAEEVISLLEDRLMGQMQTAGEKITPEPTVEEPTVEEPTIEEPTEEAEEEEDVEEGEEE